MKVVNIPTHLPPPCLVDNYSVFYTIRGDKAIVTDVLYMVSDFEVWTKLKKC